MLLLFAQLAPVTIFMAFAVWAGKRRTFLAAQGVSIPAIKEEMIPFAVLAMSACVLCYSVFICIISKNPHAYDLRSHWRLGFSMVCALSLLPMLPVSLALVPFAFFVFYRNRKLLAECGRARGGVIRE